MLIHANDLSVWRSTMSDTYRRYRAIKQNLMQFYQPRLSGHQERHLNTLVALICGLAGGHHAHLSSSPIMLPATGPVKKV